MQERTITYLTDACLITCILQKELAEDLLEAAKNCGAQGATISYAIGTGVRERMGLLGLAVDEQKEVIRIIVSKEQSELIFETMYRFFTVSAGSDGPKSDRGVRPYCSSK